ncbi:MAG: wax ester/triacylglycerol synthase family O-acyltransferase [Gammaproteobacteria bacterium]|nr:wax ester/triacylglycerol synthase family O-acyltransferase [Gammaproteobacteria bacterium]MDH3371989.1 wax ester/triacylglycerol synthase family O-acyltransferase [Gammaproteobacteria bacterium]MDH3553803.1 wax ester/triacylglycerol synthase family O-acyltransferase [Gammaproteobacteria bacterium]
MTDVPILDYAFLAFESEASPKHVAGLQIFELPQRATDDFVARLVQKIKDVKPNSPFNQKLKSQMTGMPQWIEDTDLSLDDHIIHESVPKPHTMAALLERIEVLHADGLDRSGPLWQLYIFEHVEERRFAIYFKVHHAYMDGISLSQRTMSALSEKRSKRGIGTFWGVDRAEHHKVREHLMSDLFGTAKSAGRAALVLPALAKLGLKHGLRMLHLGGDELPVPFTAPRTAFNTPLTRRRSIAVVDLPLDRVQSIARHAAVTVNDVLLELCDRALTRYLDDHGGAPDAPLVAQMPVSLRRPDVEQGNQITIAILELGSKESNPVRRLQEIHAHATDVKHEFSAMTPETAEAYTVLMQSVAQLAESIGASSIMPPLGNVVISNLIGPKKQLYLCGAPLLALYPISTIAPGLALNITIYTYKDTLHAGIVAGHSAIPDLEPIAANLRLALDELETAMGLVPEQKRPQAKKKPAQR